MRVFHTSFEHELLWTITASYTTWMRPTALVEAITGLDDEQQARYLNPPYVADL